MFAGINKTIIKYPLILFSILFIVNQTSVYLYTEGFYLQRQHISKESPLINPYIAPHSNQNNVIQQHHENAIFLFKQSQTLFYCQQTSWFAENTRQKVILMIVDSCRFDFAMPTAFTKENGLFIPIISEKIEKEPENSILFRSFADPPTVTTVRTTAMMTGSMPSFIDLITNVSAKEVNSVHQISIKQYFQKKQNFVKIAFQSSLANVNYLNNLFVYLSQQNQLDSILRQLKTNNKTTFFMGDDTWVNVYKNLFGEAYPLESFDIHDPDTVDNHVRNHLYPLLNSTNQKHWDFIIAHLLGIDHISHKLTPLHASMKEKVLEVSSTIEHVMESLDENTVLIVVSDHGSRWNGNHGDMTRDETDSVLFAYTKRGFNNQHSFQKQADENNAFQNISRFDETYEQFVSQIDLVPTLSMLLNIPIPSNNLGMLIPDMYPQIKNQSQKELLTRIMHDMYTNTMQILENVTDLQLKFNKFPTRLYDNWQQQKEEISQNYIKLSQKRQSNLLEDDEIALFIQKNQDLVSKIQNRVRYVKTEFNMTTMSFGQQLTILSGMLICLIICYIKFIIGMTPNYQRIAAETIEVNNECGKKINSFSFPFSIVAVLLITSLLLSNYCDFNHQFFLGAFATFLLIYSQNVFFSKIFDFFRIHQLFSADSFRRNISTIIIFVILVFGHILICSNSYLLKYEDYALFILMASSIVVKLVTHFKQIWKESLSIIFLLYFASLFDSSTTLPQVDFLKQFLNSSSLIKLYLPAFFNLAIIRTFLLNPTNTMSLNKKDHSIYNCLVYTNYLVSVSYYSLIDINSDYSNESIVRLYLPRLSFFLFGLIFLFQLFKLNTKTKLSYSGKVLLFGLNMYNPLILFTGNHAFLIILLLFGTVSLYLTSMKKINSLDNISTYNFIAVLGYYYFFVTIHRCEFGQLQVQAAYIGLDGFYYWLAGMFLAINTLSGFMYLVIIVPLIRDYDKKETFLHALFDDPTTYDELCLVISIDHQVKGNNRWLQSQPYFYFFSHFIIMFLTSIYACSANINETSLITEFAPKYFLEGVTFSAINTFLLLLFVGSQLYYK